VVNIKIVNNQTHKNTKIEKNPSLIQCKDMHFIPIVISEFIDLSKEFPIVFVKDGQTGVFNSVALMGLEPKENLFFNGEVWQSNYTPQLLSFYPFLIQQQSDGQALLCIDEDSPLVNEVSGDRLFDVNGGQMDWIKVKAERIVAHLENRLLTHKLIKLLIDKELLAIKTLTIKLENKVKYDLNGLYVISEEQFNDLSNDDFIELRKLGVLPSIYAVLMSMRCVNNLVTKKNMRDINS